MTSTQIPLAVIIEGGALTALGLEEVKLIQLGLRRLVSELARRDGAVPANVLVLQGRLDRVVAGAAVAGRLPSPEALGSVGSVGSGLAANVEDMDIREAAKALGCGHRNVRDLVTRGQLAGRKSGGRWLIDPLDLQELLDSRRSA